MNTIKSILSILVAFTVIILTGCTEDRKEYPDFIGEGPYSGSYFPTSGWRECSPEEVGIDPEKLKAVYDFCAEEKKNTYCFLVIKDGYIVAESYFKNYTRESLLPSYSLAKSFISALTGVAIHKGFINSTEDYIPDYLPQLLVAGADTLKKQITIRHLLTMTSGIEWKEDELSISNDIYKIKSAPDYAQYVLEKPMQYTPGKVWNYSSGMPILLSRIIENATGKNTLDFGKETLFKDLGINTASWDNDPTGHNIGAWGLKLNARDYAKLGYLYWQNGYWDQKWVLPENWVTESIQPALNNAPHYGYLFWTAYRYASHIPEVPNDTYMATGLFQKYIIIIPSYNLILFRYGENIMEGENGWDTARFIELAVEAVEQ